RSGRQLRGAELNSGKNYALAYFSADARLLVTMSQAMSSLTVWDAGSGRKLQDLKADIDNGEHLLAFAISPDGRTLATNTESDKGAGRLDALTLRDAASGRVFQTIKISERKSTPAMSATSPVRAIRFTPDGRAVAVAFHDETQDTSQVFSGGQVRTTGRAN